MALGAVEAVRAAGKLNRIMVTGTDANKDALESVRAGELTATVDSNPVAQAFVPVEAAIRYLMYKEVPPKVMIVGEGVPTIVDKSNVDEFEAGVINMLKEYGVDTKY